MLSSSRALPSSSPDTARRAMYLDPKLFSPAPAIAPMTPPTAMTSSTLPADTAVQRDPAPLDIVRRVAQYLADDGASRTLAALLSSSKATYELLTPMLYAHLLINGRRSETLIDFKGLTPTPDVSNAVEQALEDGAFFHPSSPARRLWAMGFVRSLSIRCFPDESISGDFRATAQHLTLLAMRPAGPQQDVPPTQLLFPRLRHITLEPPAVDAIRTYQPASYDVPHSPPFLEALTLISRPSVLSIRFRVLPSARWESHAAATSTGAYNFVSRLNQLHISGWDSITRLEVFGPVHQVLPSLVGVENVYHFAPHIRQSSGGIEEAEGAAARGMAGPHWSYRGWQCLTAVKNVYAAASNRERSRSRSRTSRSAPTSRAVSRAMEATRSGSSCRSGEGRLGRLAKRSGGNAGQGDEVDAEGALQRIEREKVERTSWRFVNLVGHVMTQAKSAAYVDDEEKAEEDEVDGLIKDCVTVSLGRDIAGLMADDVDGILQRIRWT